MMLALPMGQSNLPKERFTLRLGARQDKIPDHQLTGTVIFLPKRLW